MFTSQPSLAQRIERMIADTPVIDPHSCLPAAPDLASLILRSSVLDELISGGACEIVVDASELTFIDSSGISVLVSAARSASAARATLVVASPTPHVQRVFEIVNLSELVAVEQDLESALQRIGWRREQSAG